MKTPTIRKAYIGDSEQFRARPVFTLIGKTKEIVTVELETRAFEVGAEYGMGYVVSCEASGNKFRPFKVTVTTAGNAVRTFSTYRQARMKNTIVSQTITTAPAKASCSLPASSSNGKNWFPKNGRR